MGNVSALQWYVGLFKKYKKPIWLTEFANWENNPTIDDQEAFLIDAVNYLDNDPDVFRYAWFTGRFSGAPYIGLLEDNQSKLTELGNLYLAMPWPDPNSFTVVPSRIEAEAYNAMSGVSIAKASDHEGILAITRFNSDDWLEYNIDVPETRDFFFDIRYSAPTSSSIQLYLDESLYSIISFPSTGNVNAWKTTTTTINLSEGKHKLKLTAAGSGLNLNWISISKDNISGISENLTHDVTIFPNPVLNAVSIHSKEKIADIQIIDLLGKVILTPANIEFSTEGLPSGLYFVKNEYREQMDN